MFNAYYSSITLLNEVGFRRPKGAHSLGVEDERSSHAILSLGKVGQRRGGEYLPGDGGMRRSNANGGQIEFFGVHYSAVQ